MSQTSSGFMLLGVLLLKISFWSDGQYEFSFQFWGTDNNNVFISRDGVELTSFGGSSMKGILERALEWCEKANPSKKYPTWLVSNIPEV